MTVKPADPTQAPRPARRAGEVARSEQTPPRVCRDAQPLGTRIRVGEVEFGGEAFVVMAGPCAIEGQEQTQQAAAAVARHGARVLRGGAFKPRTSPYSFQGMGEPALQLLADAGRTHGMPVIAEVMDASQIPLMLEYVDVLQVGTRNMHNFTLLRALGKVRRPVMLKRGFSATFEEWMHAAEYILDGGNEQLMLCERGIRTFETATRNTLDLGAVALAKQRTHLPIIVDPSHATGLRELVLPMSLAAAAAGADGLLIDVHPWPAEALCDGSQALTPELFQDLMNRLEPLLEALDRPLLRRKTPTSSAAGVR